MLQYELTPKHAGIVLWGDQWALRDVHEVIHRINEENPIIEDKEGLLMGFAYEIRKAYEGQRLKGVRTHFEDSCPIYGTKILWPALVAQVGLLRASLAFIPSSLHEQSVLYALESIVEIAAGAAFPGKGEEILDLARLLGQYQKHTCEVLNSRSLYFIGLSPKERLRQLPLVLQTMNPMYDFSYQYWERAGRKVIAPSVFEGYEGMDWPDFKW